MNKRLRFTRYWYLYIFLMVVSYAKYIGILSALASFYFDHVVFSYLSFLALFIVVEIILNFSIFQASIRQSLNLLFSKLKYRHKMPSKETYQNKTEYILPFEGEWAVFNGCFTKAHSHSWNIVTQRYAYDFIMIDSAAKSYNQDPLNYEDYYCYDKNIVAPADGRVVNIYNKANDSIILKPGAFITRSRHIAGNYIVIKHAENEYSLCAHLKKDSFRLKVGDDVKQGQVIATCGNTGNSTEPHLHFQLQTTPHFFRGVGLPIKFTNVTMQRPDNYNQIDSRATLSKDQIPAGFITRGYLVKNAHT